MFLITKASLLTALYRSAVWDNFAFRVTSDDGGKKVADKSKTSSQWDNWQYKEERERIVRTTSITCSF